MHTCAHTAHTLYQGSSVTVTQTQGQAPDTGSLHYRVHVCHVRRGGLNHKQSGKSMLLLNIYTYRYLVHLQGKK